MALTAALFDRREGRHVGTKKATTGKQKATPESVVGSPTYSVWVDMLERLVPGDRTHRLAPLVAGMLQYAAERADQ